MILTDKIIEDEIFKGNITIGGFNLAHLNPNSYDMTLDKTCKIMHPSAIGRTDGSVAMANLDKYNAFIGEMEFTDWHLDVKEKNMPTYEFEIPESGFTLLPNHLYLYSCREIIGVKNNVCATVMGKSSLGRLGLDIHVCAGFIDSGFMGSLVLEMRTIYPLKVYPGMKICQIKFERTEGVAREQYNQKSGSKYMNQSGVQHSKMADNFKDSGSTVGPTNWATHD
jgi:dCTP deaminase